MGQSCGHCPPCTTKQDVTLDDADSPPPFPAEDLHREAAGEEAVTIEDLGRANVAADDENANAGPESAGHSLGHEFSESAGLEARVRKLLKELRAREAAQLLEQDHEEVTESGDDQGGGAREAASEETIDAVKQQLRSLGEALGRLAGHPAVATEPVVAPGELAEPPGPEQLLGVRVPAGPLPRAPPTSTKSSKSGKSAKKRDLVEVAIQLDELRRAEVAIEFYPDGSISLDWSAFDLPVELPAVLCLVHEIDLIGELVPFIQEAKLVNEFPWNEADRIVRIVSKPPIPGISAVEIVGQRFGYDLLDTPWEGLCLVEHTPEWSGEPDSWRGVKKPALYPGAKQVDVRKLAAIARPGGKKGELTTLIVSSNATLKIPRSLLPNWLITWLIPKVAHFVYKHVLDRLKNLENTEHGRRLRGKSAPLYNHLRQRIQEFVAARANTVTAAAGG